MNRDCVAVAGDADVRAVVFALRKRGISNRAVFAPVSRCRSFTCAVTNSHDGCIFHTDSATAATRRGVYTEIAAGWEIRKSDETLLAARAFETTVAVTNAAIFLCGMWLHGPGVARAANGRRVTRFDAIRKSFVSSGAHITGLVEGLKSCRALLTAISREAKRALVTACSVESSLASALTVRSDTRDIVSIATATDIDVGAGIGTSRIILVSIGADIAGRIRPVGEAGADASYRRLIHVCRMSITAC